MTADKRYKALADGTIIGVNGSPLKPETLKGGYQRVGIGGRHVLVHVAVAAAFIGPKPAGYEVNHKDGDKRNNAVTNLEYVTPRENVRHSIDVLRTERAPGEKNGNAKLTDAAVIEMRRLYADGVSTAAIAAQFDIHYSHVWRIVTGRSWRHIK